MACLLEAPVMGAIAARVVSVSGEVKLDGREARVGDNVPAGGRIVTGSDGAAKLLLADKSIVDLAKNTSFVVEASVEDVGSSTRLDFGLVRSSIQKKMEKKLKFQMRTKTSVLAVRGTEFIVNSAPSGASGASDQVTVRDGQVAVGVGSAVQTLNAGEQLMAVGHLVNNQMQVDTNQLKVVQLKPEAVQAIANQATVHDHTFVHRIEVPANGGGRTGGGDGTLVAANNVVQGNLGTNRGSADNASGEGTKGPPALPPAPPAPVGTLNSVDGSAAQHKVAQGVTVTVQFDPNG